MQRNIGRLLLISPLLSAALLMIVLFSTDPVAIGPVGILGVFVLVYIFTLSLLFVLLRFGIGWFRRLTRSTKDNFRPAVRRVGVRKSYYIASILAFVPVLFLAMQSFAQLRLSDIILVGIFVGIAVFYVIKRT